MDKEIQDMLNDLPNKKFAKNSDNRLDGFEKISYKKKGTKLSETSKNKISNSHIGKKADDLTKYKMSKTRKGVKKTEEHIEKIKNSNIGKKRTDEQKKYFSEIRLGISQPKTSETNKRLNTMKFLCPHCQREIGGKANFIRFHNDNCKLKDIS